MIEEIEKADDGNEKPKTSEVVQEEPELTNETPQDEVNQNEAEVAEETQPEADQTNQEETVETEASSSPEPVEASNEEVPQEETISENSEVAEEDTTITETEEAVPTEDTANIEASSEKETSTEEKSEASKEGDEDGKHEDHEELHEEDHEEEDVDYTQLNKEELETALAKIAGEDDGYKKGKKIFAIRDAYDVIFKKEKEGALGKFIEDGGNEDDFDYKLDDTSVKFEEYFKIIKEKRTRNARELERQKDENLAKKTALLEKLREFIDDDENTESISEMKKMQEEWKAIGPVPASQNRTLWANYNALMDRYYDHRSIYFELKELDRKKNLTAKEALCQQAETLDKLENLNEAIKKLNELHEEYKHIGPVPREVQEETWQRFKAASDKIYSKRKEYFSNLKEVFKENLDKKAALANTATELLSYQSDSISEWNAKTKEALALQKEWDAIGSMPKEKAKEINKKFWGGFKGFFKHKSEFFKTLDSQREDNLKKKEALVEKANELKESDDWTGTANALKDLQKQWKEIGPVPEKKRESIYKAFKKACDEFFNRRRDHSKDVESDYSANLAKKESVCDKLEALAGKDDLNPEQVYELQDEFNGIGFVPKKAIKPIQNRYQSALRAIVDQAKDFEDDELEELKSLISINKIKSGPHGDQKLHRKEQALKRKIQNLENDISVWKNNMGFFANSKNADELMADFNKKIEKAEKELVELKEELKLISYAGDQ